MRQSRGADWDPVRAPDGDRVGVLAAGDGVRFRHDVLAAATRLADSGRVGATAPGSARRAWRSRSDRLVASGARCVECASKRGGQETGPNPTDRGKLGTKQHLMVDGNGVPLAVELTPANAHECNMLQPMLDKIPCIRRPRGRPRRKPQKLHADKAYDP